MPPVSPAAQTGVSVPISPPALLANVGAELSRKLVFEPVKLS
jgi:hypothetical protein